MQALLGPAGGALDIGVVTEPQQLLSRLADAGWDPVRIADVASQCRNNSVRWPFESENLADMGVGAAQFHAWVQACVRLLELDATNAGVRHATQALDAEDRRLLAERPPHHGSVG